MQKREGSQMDYLPLPLGSTSVLRCRDTYKRLESSVFNSVSLGQWESARASLRCLAVSDEASVRDTARELLKVLILEASSLWRESQGIPSPHHLSWLALKTYKEFFREGTVELPDYIGALIEFRLLLYQARGMMSFSTKVANLLCQYHSVHVLQISGTSYDTIPPFSNPVFTFLHDVITMQDPALGHALITNLTVVSRTSSSAFLSSQHVSNNESLQLIYLDCIYKCLEVLEALKVSAAEGCEGNDSDSQYESDHAFSSSSAPATALGRSEKVVSMVYTLLSKIEAQPGMMRLTKMIDTLFHTLLQASYPVSGSGTFEGRIAPFVVTFNPGRIYSCLLGCSNGFLISRLHEVEEFVWVSRVSEESSLLSSPLSSRLAHNLASELADVQEREEAEEWVGGAGSGHTTPKNASVTLKEEWKDRFYSAMFDSKHLLESVLERGLQLIYTGKLQELSRLMMKPEFFPLRPVLLLLGWDRYTAVGSGKELLDVLWPMEVSMKQSLLFNGCCKLAFQVELVQWCLDKARPQGYHCAGDMFKGLKSHSTLYVLQHSTPLAFLDPLEVVDILRMRPRVPSRSILFSPPPQFSRGLTPMKQVLGDSDASPAPSPMMGLAEGPGSSSRGLFPAALKPEQERDISIFKSFCALKLVLDAVWGSVQLRNGVMPAASEDITRQSAEKELTYSVDLSSSSPSSDPLVLNEKASSSRGALPSKRLTTKVARKLELGSKRVNKPAVSEELEYDASEIVPEEMDMCKAIDQHYKSSVTDYLQEAKMYLAHVFPLNYRLEVLEDIFSLLLLTSNDVKPMKKNSVGADRDKPCTDKPSTSFLSSCGMSSLSALVKSRNEFLVDERLAAELLEVLQDCIRELRAAKYALTQQSEGSPGEGGVLACNGVQSSVSEASLNARTTRLEQYVNEARWRLQMVLSEQSTSSSSRLLSTKEKSCLGLGIGEHASCLSGSDEGSDSAWWTESEEEREKERVAGERGKVARRKKKGSLVSSPEFQDNRSGSVGSRTDLSHPHRPTSRCSSMGSLPRSMKVKQSPSPVPSSSSSVIPAPRPSGFVGSHRNRDSPTLQKPVCKSLTSSSVPVNSMLGTLESKSNSSGSAHCHSHPHRETSRLLEEEEEEDSGECADVEERSPNMPSAKKKKRKRIRSQSSQFTASRKHSLQLTEQSSEPSPSRNSIVSRMLASSGSLLRMCLRHSNYMKAGEVVRMLHMEEQFGEAIIRFSEQFEAVGRELSRQSRIVATPSWVRHSSASSTSSSRAHSRSLSRSETPRHSSSPKPPPLSVAPSLNLLQSQGNGQSQGSSAGSSMYLQMAIMNARNSFDPLQSLHQLLAPPTIHQMLFSGDSELEMLTGEDEGLQRLVNHVPSLVMLDMVCGHKISGSIATKVLEMALDRLHSDLSNVSDVSGPFALLKFVSDASIHYLESSGVPSQVALVSPPYTSPHSLLTLSTHILTPSAISQARIFADIYRLAREKLEAEIDVSTAEILASKEGGSSDVFSQLTQLVTAEEGSAGASTPVSPLRQQTPPTGNIFDELIRALHSVPPVQNLYPISVISRGDRSLGRFHRRTSDPGAEPAVVVSYLWQFSRYIRKLIELLVKCLNIKGANLNKGSLVLSVMRERPHQTLGRMIFERGILPQKLEVMMGDFPHLRITEVLVKCCCPSLPGRGVPLMKRAVGSSRVPVVALNQGESLTMVGNPCIFSHKLLTKLFKVLKRLSSQSLSQESSLTPKDLASAYSNPDVQKVLRKTSSLASVDLSMLNSSKKQMAFYTNVLNVLYAHALMFFFSLMTGDRAMSPNGAEDKRGLSVGSISVSLMQSSRVVQAAMFGKVGYHLGQLGLVSCFDLHHSIVSRGLTPPTLVKDAGLQSRLVLKRSDPWMTYAPSSPDPRLFYMIHDGRMTCPAPVPLSVENIDCTVASAEAHYLNANVRIDVGRKTVTIPSPLAERCNDFGKIGTAHGPDAQSSGLAHSHVHLADMALFRYLQSRLDASKADILLTMMDAWEVAKSKRVHLSIRQTSSKLAYNFGSMGEGLALMVTNSSPRASPKGRKKKLSRESSRKDSLPLSPDQLSSLPSSSAAACSAKRYSFTPEIFEFVKNQKPLLAGLIALVCPPLPSSFSSTTKLGTTIDEETRVEGGSDPPNLTLLKDREIEETSKSFMRNFRSKMVSPSPSSQAAPTGPSLHTFAPAIDVSPSRSLTFPKIPGISDNDSTQNLTPWLRHYNSVIAHFPLASPMKRFLEARLSPFEGIVPWWVESQMASVPSELSELGLCVLAAAPLASEDLENACMLVMKHLMESGCVAEAVQFLASEPAAGSQQVHVLAHMALSCHFVSNYKELLSFGDRRHSSFSNTRAGKGGMTTVLANPVPIFSQLSDPECAARLSLASLHNWSVDVCVEMLDYCHHHLPASSNLTSSVSKKLEKMKVYARIMSTCHNPLSGQMAAGGMGKQLDQGHPAPWKTWVDLAKDSETKSNYVLRILLESKEFELSREWCRVHELGSSVTRQIEVDYLFDLLERGTPDPIVAHQKLDSLPDNRMPLEVCEALLAEKMTTLKMEVDLTEVDLKTMVFVLEYMLTWLSISLVNKKDYSNILLGVKALLCLPRTAYSEYKHLIQCPLLLVEQLVMDLKIHWAASVIRELRSTRLLHMLNVRDTPSLSHMLVVEEEDEEGGKGSRDPFCKILMFYCSRALDFPQPVLTSCTPASSAMHSVPSSEPSTPALMMSGNYRGTAPAAAPGRTTAASGFKEGHHRNISLVDQYPAATPRVPLGYNRSSSMSTMPSNEVGGYQPPLAPPLRELWEKDTHAKECRICEAHFGMFMRRHHCRCCGRVVCAACSSHVDPVNGYDRSVRTCNTCHNLISPHTSSDVNQQPDAAGAAMGGGGASDLAEGVWIAGMLTDVACNQEGSWMQNIYPLHQNYKLISGDPVVNASVRSEFYYEHTPNSVLCLSLADLLIDKQQAAGLILDCCHTVSAQLVPDSQGRVNAELDHYFVISLIQNLLLNAKLRFAEANASSGVELCDTYLSRVDILRLLVSSRYNKIPSIQELTKPDLARRVRDRLIQDDRFGLAMEVSTKCQLDTVAVWSAWGVACLKSGDFSEARSKLKHCFQISSQLGSSGQNLHLLDRVIEQIEQHPLSVAGRHTRLSDDWSGVILGSTAITQKTSDEYDIDSVRFGECVYYLRTYGSHSSIVAFFVKHLSWRQASIFILDHNCSSDVFVEGLWIPVLKSGKVEQVMASMKELDPSLGVWEHHLTAACCYFSRKSLFSVLLTTQLFMNDFIRAGLTCIKFFIGFSGRSTTITGLFERLSYLDQATKHFQTSLNSKIRMADRGRSSMRERVQRVFEDTGSGRVSRGSSPGVKSMNVSELRSHLDTVSLQKQVVIHLFNSAKAMGTLRDPLCVGGWLDYKSSNTNSGRPMPMSPPPSSSSSPTHCSSSSSSSSGQPPTLFRNAHVRAEVAALVITCSHDLGDGFNIARDIIENFKLNLRQVFCDAARGLALRQRYGDIRFLLQYIFKDYQSRAVSLDVMNDDIVMAAIKVLANQPREGKQVEKLVAMLISERSKIKALVQCGKLKAAYLVAIRAKLADEVQGISEIANKAGHLPVRDICNKWLQANAPYPLQRQ